MDIVKKNNSVLKEEYLFVCIASKDPRQKAQWVRRFCVLERHIMCMYEQNPWISTDQELKGFFKLSITSVCGDAKFNPVKTPPQHKVRHVALQLLFIIPSSSALSLSLKELLWYSLRQRRLLVHHG